MKTWKAAIKKVQEFSPRLTTAHLPALTALSWLKLKVEAIVWDKAVSKKVAADVISPINNWNPASVRGIVVPMH